LTGFFFMRGDRTKGSLRERISLMFRERTREGRPFREAKRVRFPFSSTKIQQKKKALHNIDAELFYYLPNGINTID
jgi:hypothetical protein